MFSNLVKDTFQDELADVMIRVMDLAAHKDIDLEIHIAAKMRYNSLREYKHEKRY
jgi:NTP pyrophosphatase (non-canonical NTP hydrolase)